VDTCGFERVERFRINLSEKNFASQKNTLTSSLPQRCRAVGTYGAMVTTAVKVNRGLRANTRLAILRFCNATEASSIVGDMTQAGRILSMSTSRGTS